MHKLNVNKNGFAVLKSNGGLLFDDEYLVVFCQKPPVGIESGY